MKKIYAVIMIILLLAQSAPCAQGQIAADTGALNSVNSGRITLDLKGMDVIEVLKMIAAKGNLNIIIGSDVQGKVTLLLNDVSISDAFEMILMASNLAVDKRGDIIYIMSQRGYEQFYGKRYGERTEVKTFDMKYARASEAGKIVDQIRSNIGKVIIDADSNTITMIDSPGAVAEASDMLANIDRPTVTRIFELNYILAANIKDRITEMLTKEVGKLRIDERTNKIIVTDTDEKIKEIEQVVTSFDQKIPEVLIDAKIVEITLDDNFKLGIDWQAVLTKLGKEINLKNSFKLAAEGAFIPGGEILIGSFSGNDWAALIQILKTVGDTNTLSNPRIMTLNNQEAKIIVGTNQPYATNTVTQGTSTTTTATNLTFIDIGVKLYVTPVINRDGYITMKLKPEVSNQSGTYTYGTPPTTVPIISTTQAETNVMVKDGTTIIIAGLIKDNRTSTVNKVPFLGDIPYLGLAFQNTVNEIQKKELVIFLTPHIISPDVDQMKQMRESPENEKLFTMPEWPTFDKRKGVAMNSGYLDERSLGAGKVTADKLTPEEYFVYIRDNIIQNMKLTDEDKMSLKKGDKAKISFVLYSGGALVMAPEVDDSSNMIFGQRVKDAVERANPFPRFPISIQGTTKNFALELIYDPDHADSKNRNDKNGKK